MAEEAVSQTQHRDASDPRADVVPGTDFLLDVDHKSHLKQGQGSDIILIPQPSNNLNDPLNWSPTWKYLVVLVQFAYTFIAVEAALSIAPMFPLLAAEFKLNQTQLNLLSGACILGQAYANFIIVPYSNIFGRRQASLTLAVFIILTEVWEALATSDRSLLAARVLNGLATAISESVMVQVINDVFFLHERGGWMGVYFVTYFLGIFLGTIIAGNIAGSHGWRSFFWLSVALSGFNLITLFFFFPETKYKRSNQWTETTLQDAASPTLQEKQDGSGKAKRIEEVQSQESTPTSPTSRGSSLVGKGRPSKPQFALWQKPDPRWKSFLWRDVLTPFRIFFYPIIFWTGITVAGSVNINLFYVLTESEVLSAPPYNFSTSAVGYSNFGFMGGGIVGLLTAGPFSDYVARRAARKNNGIREAEMRLPTLVPFVCTTIVGLVVGGLAYQRQWSWPILLVFGYGLAGLTVTTIPTIVITYAIDSYKPLAGEIMVVATVVKNTCGFSMSYWVPQLAAEHGFITPAMVQFALSIGTLLMAIPLYFYGKRLREATKNSYVHQLSEY